MLSDLLSRLLNRCGALAATLILTGLAVLLSMGVTALVVGVFWGEVELDTLAVAAVVAAVNAPLFGYAQLRTLEKLEAAKAGLQHLADTDGLTGAYNRRYFQERVAEELSRVSRYGGALSALLLDIDDFKSLNDRHGHTAGDRALVAVARACLAEVRRADVFARYGGEEFALLLPETDLEHAYLFAERLREVLAGLEVDAGDTALRLTVSVGVAATGAGASVDALLKTADDALYRAKRQGKNRVEGRVPPAAGAAPALT